MLKRLFAATALSAVLVATVAEAQDAPADTDACPDEQPAGSEPCPAPHADVDRNEDYYAGRTGLSTLAGPSVQATVGTESASVSGGFAISPHRRFLISFGASLESWAPEETLGITRDGLAASGLGGYLAILWSGTPLCNLFADGTSRPRDPLWYLSLRGALSYRAIDYATTTGPAMSSYPYGAMDLAGAIHPVQPLLLALRLTWERGLDGAGRLVCVPFGSTAAGCATAHEEGLLPTDTFYARVEVRVQSSAAHGDPRIGADLLTGVAFPLGGSPEYTGDLGVYVRLDALSLAFTPGLTWDPAARWGTGRFSVSVGGVFDIQDV